MAVLLLNVGYFGLISNNKLQKYDATAEPAAIRKFNWSV